MNTASVVIPIKNGGPLLKRVVSAVLAQKTSFPFDLWLIDSGSSDQSQNWIIPLAKSDSRVHFHEIEPDKFQHGRTRNLGISLCQGDFIALLTQDALPVNESWLENLVQGFKAHDSVAGTFGRHVGYDGGNPLVRRDIDLHFQNLNQLPQIHRWENDSDESDRQRIHFFSNNNSCIRREAWKVVPFPEVDFAEDQAWAWAVIEAGYSTVYTHSACVFHSHSYSIFQTFKRNIDESYAMKGLFGYVYLCSLKSLLGRTVLQSLRDWKYLYAHKEVSAWFIKVPFLNFAKYLGQYIASKMKKESRLYSELSLDQKLKRS